MLEASKINRLEGARGGAGLKELRSGGESRDRTRGVLVRPGICSFTELPPWRREGLHHLARGSPTDEQGKRLGTTGAGGRGHQGVDDQPVAVLHQIARSERGWGPAPQPDRAMAHVAELRLLPRGWLPGATSVVAPERRAFGRAWRQDQWSRCAWRCAAVRRGSRARDCDHRPRRPPAARRQPRPSA